MSIRVQICDDDPIVREAITAYLRPEPDLEVVGCHGDAESALDALDGERPDVVLMDLVLPGIDGVEATRRVVENSAPATVVVLTVFGTQEHVRDAIAAGASGFLLKASAPECIVGTVRAVAAGAGIVLTPDLVLQFPSAGRVRPGLHHLPPPADRVDPGSAGLTPRERDVLALLCRAESNAGIAEILKLSESTVKKHVATLMGKLGCSSRLEVAVRAFEFGMVRPRYAHGA